MEQAREYWERVDRPNLMIKIPGTDEGVPAIEEMIYEGININVTLLFAVERYERVAEAYIRGARAPPRRGQEHRRALGRVVLRLARRHARSTSGSRRSAAPELRGRAGARQRARRLPPLQGDLPTASASPSCATAGASVQRPLWASTGVKNPTYPDTMYVDGWSAPTPSTRCRWRRCSPPPTTRASSGATAELGPEADLRALAEAGIDLDDVTAKLLARRRREVRRADRQAARRHRRPGARRSSCRARRRSRPSIPDELEPRDRRRACARRWPRTSRTASGRRTTTLWGPAGQAEVANRLGWLTIADTMLEAVDDLEAFAREVRDEGFTGRRAARDGRLVARARGDPPELRRAGRLRSRCTCSTRPTPGAIRAIETRGRPRARRCSSSRRSRAGRSRRCRCSATSGRCGPRAAQFVAITDPGLAASSELASEHGFRRTFLNDPEHRRALQRAVVLRARARRADGRRRRRPARPRRQSPSRTA